MYVMMPGTQFGMPMLIPSDTHMTLADTGCSYEIRPVGAQGHAATTGDMHMKKEKLQVNGRYTTRFPSSR